jgi:uncharacterized protein YecT (DUF1311 family)
MNQKDSPCAGVVVTAELSGCLSKARHAADLTLNAVYKQVLGNLEKRDAQQLIATQRLWLQFRDSNCAAARDLYEGGTASTPAYVSCLEAMTRARTRELQVIYAVRLK